MVQPQNTTFQSNIPTRQEGPNTTVVAREESVVWPEAFNPVPKRLSHPKMSPKPLKEPIYSHKDPSMLICPVCDSVTDSIKCKLVCPNCHTIVQSCCD